MTRGGPRNRSGPQADPESEKSSRRGLAYRLLPSEGFTGRVPAFPLPQPSARERAVWKELWRTPQAAMWNEERWRMHTVGLYCRWSVRAEAVTASAAVVGQVHRLADQLGLTPAGMRENGWRVRFEVQPEPSSRPTPAEASGPSPRRLRPVVDLGVARGHAGEGS